MPAAFFRQSPMAFAPAAFPGSTLDPLARLNPFSLAIVPVTAQAYDRPTAFPYDADVRRINPKARGEGMVGYVLRADRRSPETLAAAGGFWPQCTSARADPSARSYVEPLSFTGHFMNSTHQGLVSTTTSPRVVRGYARNGQDSDGYVYGLLVEGGYDVGRRMKSEVVAAGGIPWFNVVAYVEPTVNGAPCRLLVREGFPAYDPKGWRALYSRMASLT